MPQSLTPHLIDRAKLMRMDRASWNAIAKTLDVSEYCVRCAVDQAYRDYRRQIEISRHKSERKTEPKRERIRIRPKANHAVQHVVHSHTHLAPPEVLAERDLALELRFVRPRSITAQLLGDPLPGRSALDQRKREA